MSAFLDETGTLITVSSSNPLPVNIVSSSNPLPVDDGVATADDGVILPLDSLAKSFGYAGDNLTTITVSHNGATYVKTLTYTGDKLTATSAWVKQ